MDDYLQTAWLAEKLPNYILKFYICCINQIIHKYMGVLSSSAIEILEDHFFCCFI